MSTFYFIFESLFPILLIIFLGYLLRRLKVINETFLKQGNKLVFKVLLPVYLFTNLYDLESLADFDGKLLLIVMGIIIIIFFIFLMIVVLFINQEQRSVVLQGAIRSNNAILGIPLALLLIGDDGVAMVSLMSLASIPIFNVLGIIALSIFKNQEDKPNLRIKNIILNILKNPLIISIISGLLVLIIRFYLLNGIKYFAVYIPYLYQSFKMIGSISGVFALILLGGQFTFTDGKNHLRAITLASVLKIIVMPSLAFGIILLFDHYQIITLTPSITVALMAIFATPTAVTSVVLAEQMGHNPQVASEVVVYSSILSIITIFLLCFILKVNGFL